MTREEIINGLKFTIEMFLFDSSTGETITEPRNDMDRTTIDACKGAIELLEQIPDLKEAYNKGYKDGQEALAVHYEFCKEEGSIVTVPEGATNGDMIKALFPPVNKYESTEYHYFLFAPSCHLECCNEDWWNSPYRKEQK